MRYLALIPLLAVVLASCGGGDENGSGDAGQFAVDLYTAYFKGQSGRMYESLHPAHKEAVPRDLFVGCSTQAGQALDISVDETFTENLDVAKHGESETTAVTLQFESNDDSVFRTSHVVEEDGELYWILSQDSIDAYEGGSCP